MHFVHAAVYSALRCGIAACDALPYIAVVTLAYTEQQSECINTWHSVHGDCRHELHVQQWIDLLIPRTHSSRTTEQMRCAVCVVNHALRSVTTATVLVEMRSEMQSIVSYTAQLQRPVSGCSSYITTIACMPVIDSFQWHCYHTSVEQFILMRAHGSAVWDILLVLAAILHITCGSEQSDAVRIAAVHSSAIGCVILLHYCTSPWVNLPVMVARLQPRLSAAALQLTSVHPQYKQRLVWHSDYCTVCSVAIMLIHVLDTNGCALAVHCIAEVAYQLHQTPAASVPSHTLCSLWRCRRVRALLRYALATASTCRKQCRLTICARAVHLRKTLRTVSIVCSCSA
eukprot:17344-Heterococcus_DN1.PRE.7